MRRLPRTVQIEAGRDSGAGLCDDVEKKNYFPGRTIRFFFNQAYERVGRLFEKFNSKGSLKLTSNGLLVEEKNIFMSFLTLLTGWKHKAEDQAQKNGSVAKGIGAFFFSFVLTMHRSIFIHFMSVSDYQGMKVK